MMELAVLRSFLVLVLVLLLRGHVNFGYPISFNKLLRQVATPARRYFS